MAATRTADVAVIGAGILGAAAAYHLAAAGHRVVVLERGPVNREGSGTTAGNLHIQAIHACRPGQAVPVDVGRMLLLQVAAVDYWRTIEDDLGRSVELRQSGGFSVAETGNDAAELRHKHALETAAGLPAELVDGDAARQEFPLLARSVQLADWCPLDGYANPLLVTNAYLDAAVRLGAEVHAFSPVTAVTGPHGGYRVTAGGQSWSAAMVMNLAGPWITPVAALAVRILPFLRELRLLRAWAGPLAATPDEMPVIGEVPGWPGYFVAGGTYAFTLAPLWARCLTALAENRDPPADLAGLGPERLLTPAAITTEERRTP